MNETQDNLNNCSYSKNNTSVPIGLVGDTPTPVKLFAVEDDQELGTVHTPQELIVWLNHNRTVPDYFYADCPADQWAVWCDLAWRSLELAAYSDGIERGDRGVA